jgi:hypothetical protein
MNFTEGSTVVNGIPRMNINSLSMEWRNLIQLISEHNTKCSPPLLCGGSKMEETEEYLKLAFNTIDANRKFITKFKENKTFIKVIIDNANATILPEEESHLLGSFAFQTYLSTQTDDIPRLEYLISTYPKLVFGVYSTHGTPWYYWDFIAALKEAKTFPESVTHLEQYLKDHVMERAHFFNDHAKVGKVSLINMWTKQKYGIPIIRRSIIGFYLMRHKTKGIQEVFEAFKRSFTAPPLLSLPASQDPCNEVYIRLRNFLSTNMMVDFSHYLYVHFYNINWFHILIMKNYVTEMYAYEALLSDLHSQLTTIASDYIKSNGRAMCLKAYIKSVFENKTPETLEQHPECLTTRYIGSSYLHGKYMTSFITIYDPVIFFGIPHLMTTDNTPSCERELREFQETAERMYTSIIDSMTPFPVHNTTLWNDLHKELEDVKEMKARMDANQWQSLPCVRYIRFEEEAVEVLLPHFVCSEEDIESVFPESLERLRMGFQ